MPKKYIVKIKTHFGEKAGEGTSQESALKDAQRKENESWERMLENRRKNDELNSQAGGYLYIYD